MSELELVGLEGNNPLGFFAALGVLTVLEMNNEPAALHWSDGPTPIAVLTADIEASAVIEACLFDALAWERSVLFAEDASIDVKFEPDDLLGFLRVCSEDGWRSRGLSQALATEGSFARDGRSKPSDLHFTAGQQRWLKMAREIRSGLDESNLTESLFDSWRFKSDLPSLMWDVTDDRVYALGAVNPSGETKLSETGAEWLAIVGLLSFPVFAGRVVDGKGRTLTTGCAGTWEKGSFLWSLWSEPLRLASVRSLVGVVAGSEDLFLDQLGCFVRFRSNIRRSDQGGYGSLGPPVIQWQKI